MKVTHQVTVQLDIATLPVPDLEDPAQIDQIKQLVIEQTTRHIDAHNESLREVARSQRLMREPEIIQQPDPPTAAGKR